MTDDFPHGSDSARGSDPIVVPPTVDLATSSSTSSESPAAQGSCERHSFSETKSSEPEAPAKTVNDPAWTKFDALVESAEAQSLDERDTEHWTLAAIVEMRAECESRGEDLLGYWKSHGVQVRKEVKSPFQPPVMYLLSRMEKRSGQKHTSKASKMAGALDDYWDFERVGIDGKTGHAIDPVTPDRLPDWFNDNGGYSGIYDRRRERGKQEPVDQAARYEKFLQLPPVESRPIPEWLRGGYGGEVLLAAHIDPASGEINYRGAWQPKDRRSWYGTMLNHLIASRPEYGGAVRPIDHLARYDGAAADFGTALETSADGSVESDASRRTETDQPPDQTRLKLDPVPTDPELHVADELNEIKLTGKHDGGQPGALQEPAPVKRKRGRPPYPVCIDCGIKIKPSDRVLVQRGTAQAQVHRSTCFRPNDIGQF